MFGNHGSYWNSLSMQGKMTPDDDEVMLNVPRCQLTY